MTPYPLGPARPYSGPAKFRFCKLMVVEDWRGLADLFDITADERKRFRPGDEPRSLWELVEARGRLHQLEGHLDTLGLDHVLKAMQEAMQEPEMVVLHPPPDRQRDLNTLFFDLDDLRHDLITEAGAPGPVLCFAVPHRDAVIGDKVLEWLPYCFPGIECKPKRGLGPLHGNVDALIRWLLGFRHELANSDVGVHVDALRANDEVLADFVRRVHEAFRDWACRLVLLATVAPDMPTPEGVTRLSSPVFRRMDVGNWAQRILAERGWPLTLSRALEDMIHEYAGEAEYELDPSRTYEVLESYITHLLSDAADFRCQLEQRSKRA